MLAEAAGYTDHELWWEHQIEQRQDGRGLFAGIMEAMADAARHRRPAGGREARREAHMRQSIRAAQKEGFERIAVVCGAWHAPVLADHGSGEGRRGAAGEAATGQSRGDLDSLDQRPPGLPQRLRRGGHVARLVQPPVDRARPHTIRWLARAADVLREKTCLASSSNVIEAVRLADALAAMRDLPMPGLAELNEAIQTVLCGGDPRRWADPRPAGNRRGAGRGAGGNASRAAAARS